MESRQTHGLIVWAAFLALVIVLTNMWMTTKPAPPLHFDADALRLVAWESPTGFLLAEDFPAPQPD